MTTHVTQVEPLLSYVIASSDMRYIEINEREIYLRDDPQRGLVMQGEIPECGPDCYANLSQVLLEFAMCCEDCGDHAMTAAQVELFGVRLGERLLANLYSALIVPPDIDRLTQIIEILLNSLGVSFKKEMMADYLRYELAYCPIRAVAQKSGLSLWVAPARRAFVALCSYVVQTVAPERVLVQPSYSDTDTPLDKLLISSAEALT